MALQGLRAVSTVMDKSVKSPRFAREKCADLKKVMPLFNWSQIIFPSLRKAYSFANL